MAIYKSEYTGLEIDAAIGAVSDKVDIVYVDAKTIELQDATSTTITIPSGRMAGDISGNGLIESGQDLGGSLYFNTVVTGLSPLAHKACDINNDNYVNSSDISLLASMVSDDPKIMKANPLYTRDVSGVWDNRIGLQDTSYTDYVFSTMITVPGMTATTKARLIIIPDDNEIAITNARLYPLVECDDGFITVRSLRVPIMAINGIIQTWETNIATPIKQGYMSPTDKAKLDTIEENAQALYDKVIRTQTEFEALIASSNWLGVVSVAFVGDGGTLKFTRSDGTGILIPQTVNRYKVLTMLLLRLLILLIVLVVCIMQLPMLQLTIQLVT